MIDATGLPSGTVYPALSRLERDGYVRSAWEDDVEAHASGRPARRYYRVTAPGTRALNDAWLAYYRSIVSPIGDPRRQDADEGVPCARAHCFLPGAGRYAPRLET